MIRRFLNAVGVRRRKFTLPKLVESNEALSCTRTCLTRGTKEEVLEKALASKCTCSDIEILIVENGVKEIDQTSKNPRKGIRTTMISPNATWVISDCFRTRSKSNPGLLVMFLPESIYIYIYIYYLMI
ncbi:hypothetical protein YC2023_035334 [Brassica napus]